MTLVIYLGMLLLYKFGMAEDNQVFEWMIHIMEFGVVFGIGVVVWFIRKQQRASIKPAHTDPETPCK